MTLQKYHFQEAFFFENVLFTGGMGWDGVGWTEYQKRPSIFFILCGYIDHVYVYLYNQKLSPTFLWVSKFDVKLGVGEHNFQKYAMFVSF